MLNKTDSRTQAANLCGMNRVAPRRWVKAGRVSNYHITPEDLGIFIRTDLGGFNMSMNQSTDRIMVIDDDPAMRKFVRQPLERQQIIVKKPFNPVWMHSCPPFWTR